MASELMSKFLTNDAVEDQDLEYLFESDYKRTGNNIYDDTNHRPEDEGI